MKIGIAMATYNPNSDFFCQQIESLRKQKFSNWECVISDDSEDSRFSKAIQAEIGDDKRFHFIPNLGQLPRGVFYNFENALSHLTVGCEFIAFCDQDDFWAPNKLQRLVEVLGQNPGKQLIHSDLQLIDEQGMNLQPSCWKFENRSFREPDSLLNLIIRNRVTGCATLFRRDLLDLALPFPKNVKGEYMHDHWMATMALVAGGIVELPEPLVSYRQHGANVIGAAATRGRGGILKKLEKLAQFKQKSIKALLDRQKLASDVIQRISVKLPAMKDKANLELSPLTKLEPTYYFKNLIQTRGQFPEVGLGLQLFWASLQRQK